ncbi:MAG: ATP-dependent DNA helicase RecG [Deltaproteobacteria bacterium]|nr:ATP-dependent DNA helicase RecG [Deltaproteobacteria bacterium]
MNKKEKNGEKPTDPGRLSENTSNLLNAPVSLLKGVGPKLSDRLSSREIRTIRDVLFFLPIGYEECGSVERISDLNPGRNQQVRGTIKSIQVKRGPRWRKRLEVIVFDSSGSLAAVWFRYFPGKAAGLERGNMVRLSGKVSSYKGRLQMVHPDVEPGEGNASDKLRPVYPEVPGIPRKTFRKIIGGAVEGYAKYVEDPLPGALRKRLGLPDLIQALRQVHLLAHENGAGSLQVENLPAQRRMLFEEFFYLQVALAQRKYRLSIARGIGFSKLSNRYERLKSQLPFLMTDAQKRAIAEIFSDMERPAPMNRLLQGDVGSGKTLVAMSAVLKAVDSGYQAAIMAPTEVLAEQHVRTLETMFRGLDVRHVLLTGRLKASLASRRREWLQLGIVQVAIGTHALIQRSVEFERLGLVVIDEQHRFGVGQRNALRGKGLEPDVLVMTATPIPRTLAMTVYGDLDVSVLDEMPPGRLPVETRVIGPADLLLLQQTVKEALDDGGQVYWVFPKVEQSDNTGLMDAVSGVRMVRKMFPGVEVGLAHGKLPAQERQAAMDAFRRGETRILVCTTVIEVGLDVPSATVIVVEHAERFGLSQLHQLRGRVGRGMNKSYCLLVIRKKGRGDAFQRLLVLEQTTDGFIISEKDMQIRGPGEMLGTRQSGVPGYLLSKAARFPDLLSLARKEAYHIVDGDPYLEKYEHRLLRNVVERMAQDKLGFILVG